jgi:ATP-dependent Clp protease ATP-binding subunit ClpA
VSALAFTESRVLWMADRKRGKVIRFDTLAAVRLSRIGGADRYEVSANVARRFDVPNTDTVFVPSGEKFADALTVGPMVSRLRALVLLSTRSSLPDSMLGYGEKHSVARLLGAPPGYVGYESGGQLTEAVRRRPYSVVLLDEVEKAHPEVFDVLLQVLDDGRLTDGQGRTVDFRNTLLILTSNLGSQFLVDPSLTPADRETLVQAAVRQAFKPEFVNRLDDIVVFQALTEEDLAQIVSLYVDRLSHRLASRRLSLAVTPDARTWLAERGYDPIYGARPLRRLMQKQIDDRLAMALLAGDVRDGDSVRVDVAPGGEALTVVAD